MPWGPEQDGALLDFFRRLVAFRVADPRLWRGERTTIARDDASGLYAYRCANGTDEAVVALNNGDDTVEFNTGGMPGWSIVFATDAGAVVAGDTVVIPARSGVICMPVGTGRPDVAE